MISIRALLVDDDNDMLFIARTFLEEQAPDIEVVTCDSAKKALIKFEEDAFDIIVSDYQMPEMDGLDFLETVRKSGNEIPFIIFTGRGREEVAIQALNLGATHYLKKGGEPRSQFVEFEHHIRTAVSHRKSEIALHESEGRYRSLFWDSAVSMWEEDFSDVKKFFDEIRAEGITDFREYFENHPEDVEKCVGLVIVNDVNKASIELQNVKEKQDLIGPLKRVFHKDGLGVFKEQLIALAEGNNLFKSDIYQVRDFIGIKHVFKFQLSIPSGYEETLTKVYLSIIDVTEKSETEILAQQESKKAQIYLELSSVLFVALDIAGRVEFVNSHTCSIMGYQEEELIGKDWFDLAIPGNIQTSVKEFFSECIAGKADLIHYHEHPIKTKLGEERIIAWHKKSLTDELGNITGILCSGEDVTDKRLMNEALQESEEKYRLVLNSMNHRIFVFDRNNCYSQIYASKKSDLITTRDKMLGRHVSEFIPPSILKSYLEALNNVRKTGVTQRFESSYEHDNKIIWVVSILTLHEDEESIVSVSSDITEQKLTEIALQDSEERYRSIFDNVIVGLSRTQMEDGKILFCNDALANILGYETPKEVIDNYVTSEHYVNPKFRSQVLKKFQKHGGVQTFQAEITKRDGTRIWIEFSSKLNEDAGYFENVVIDITEKVSGNNDSII